LRVPGQCEGHYRVISGAFRVSRNNTLKPPKNLKKREKTFAHNWLRAIKRMPKMIDPKNETVKNRIKSSMISLLPIGCM